MNYSTKFKIADKRKKIEGDNENKLISEAAVDLSTIVIDISSFKYINYVRTKLRMIKTVVEFSGGEIVSLPPPRYKSPPPS